MNHFLNNLIFSNASGFIALLGVYLAFSQYFFTRFDAKLHILRSIKSQLKISGLWADKDGEGYIVLGNDTEKLKRSSPFYLIFGVENDPFKVISVQQGIISFSENFLDNIHEYNQMLQRIKDLQSFRDSIVVNNLEESLILENEINSEIQVIPVSYDRFINKVKDLKIPKLLDIVTKLFNYNYQIHYLLIGSRHSGGLKTIYHKLWDQVNKELDKLEKSYTRDAIVLVFIILFFVFCSIFFGIRFDYMVDIHITLISIIVFMIYKMTIKRKFYF